MVTFDPGKNDRNIARHGLPLMFGARVLSDPGLVEAVDDRMDYGETRWNALGMVEGTVYVLTYADRAAGPHFISVRRADRRETDSYFAAQGCHR